MNNRHVTPNTTGAAALICAHSGTQPPMKLRPNLRTHNLRTPNLAARISKIAMAAAIIMPLSVIGTLSGTKAQAETLHEELAYLLSSSPVIASASDKAVARRYDIETEHSRYYPDLRLSADIGHEKIDRTDQAVGNETSLTRRRAELRSSVTLLDGKERDNRVGGATSRSDLAGYAQMQTRQIVLFDGVSAYLEVIRLANVLDLSRQNEQTVRDQLELEDERVTGGVGVAVDVLFAKARLQKAKEDRTALEGELANAIARYSQVFGHTPNIKSLKTPAPLQKVLPTNLQDAVDLAWNENLDLAASIAAEEAARYDRDVADSADAPRVALVGAASHEEDTLGERGRREDYSIRAQLNWALFDGFATRSRTKAADHDYAAARHDTIHKRRQVEEDVRTSFNQLETARQRVSLLENAAELSTAVHAARVKQRKAGQTTALTVLDAERERFDTEIALRNARSAEQIAEYRLLLAIGRLNSETLGIGGNVGTAGTPAPEAADAAAADADVADADAEDADAADAAERAQDDKSAGQPNDISEGQSATKSTDLTADRAEIAAATATADTTN